MWYLWEMRLNYEILKYSNAYYSVNYNVNAQWWHLVKKLSKALVENKEFAGSIL